jgi:GT2 family glycosyltransferase
MANLTVVTPIYKPVFSELRECLRSANEENVEHILVLDGLENIQNLGRLKRMVKKYSATLKISPTQVGISEASNIGAAEAKGEFLVFLDQDDFLVKNWSRSLMQVTQRADLVYSDSFVSDIFGKPIRHHQKPDWSPVRLIFNMYAVHFLAVRKTIFDKVGGFRSEFNGSQDHDLALRISRETNRIERLPVTLYNWRESRASTITNPLNKIWAYDAGVAAAQDHLDAMGYPAKIEKVENFPGSLRASFSKRIDPVSVVIPTAFQANPLGFPYVEVLVKSIIPFLNANLGDEIVIVHSGEIEAGSVNLDEISQLVPVVSVKDLEDFNFSQRCNIGFLSAKNDHVLLLNDDIEFGSENPLDSLFGLLGLPNVGLVGGLLAFPDYSIQHGGHAFNSGLPTHAHYMSRSIEKGLGDLIVDHEVVGVTGALMFQLKSTWETVGGFTHSLPLNFNDVDYCQKIRTLGFDIVQANSVQAIHHESVTREANVEPWELSELKMRWADSLKRDDFFTR